MLITTQGPFAGLLLADYGATVLRVDRPARNAHSRSASPNDGPAPTGDGLVRHKRSVCLSLKSESGITLFKSLIPYVDVVIDPFRPGVLERLGLGPEEVLMKLNPRLIIGRMTGYRREGKYAHMAGHDINYLAVSGALAMLGRKDQAPYPPGNILGDFAGGGHVLFSGILLALIQRHTTGKGQVVEANMVDGAAYLATFPRLSTKTPAWDGPRGTNQLDGGAPYYNVYETKDGKYMTVGALEPQFFAELLQGLGLTEEDLPGDHNRYDKQNWPELTDQFAKIFKSKSRKDWERIFDGTDACVAPILEQHELEAAGYQQRPMVTLKDSPGLAIARRGGDGSQSRGEGFMVDGGQNFQRRAEEGQGTGVEGQGWATKGMRPGHLGEKTLTQWTGWRRGVDYVVVEDDGALGWRGAEKGRL